MYVLPLPALGTVQLSVRGIHGGRKRDSLDVSIQGLAADVRCDSPLGDASNEP